MFLGFKILGDGPSDLIGWMRCPVEVNLDWTTKGSSFFIGIFEK